ncbi:MAG TPA: iron ABC transporter permease [bacterium]|mgnify:CR=1 FL=1|nr:iron ABC transporter permease [bacterium]HOL34310.1 iron ABC transporter permease [bacterium]HPP08616.1 iron ABC transporter permease [bacterium]
MKKISFLAIFLFAAASVIIGLSSGTENYPLTKIIKILFNPPYNTFERTILLQIRLPRIWCGFLTGSGLAVSGLILQAILKNPLAESYTLGVSGGASLGIAFGIVSGHMMVVPVFAFAGSVVSTFILLLIASLRKMSSGTLLLLGIMLNFIFSSFSLLIITLLQKERFMEAVVWFMGNLSSYHPETLKSAPLFLIPAYLITWLYWKQLNIFSLGEEKAITLGIDPEKKRYMWLTLTGLITGYCVSLAGLVGFVGLVIPHTVRILVGTDHKKTIPAAILAGGSFLIIADTLARTIVKPIEIPVGVISGFFGGIFFVLILLKTSRRQKW